ncbi:MAG: stage III sporulation protein AF [Ruminococcus sp.]|nr:stage III sporulation protein AF [Ruminococcus sp.]
MSGLQTVCVTLCYTCIAVSIISLLVPQKRTRRVMGFVIGLFFISTMTSAVAEQVGQIQLSEIEQEEITIPEYSEEDFDNEIAQMTADNLTSALNELLLNEGIQAQDIQLTLKISDKGRISVVRAVIYINEADRSRTSDIRSIIYRNIAKEPKIYVDGEEPQ